MSRPLDTVLIKKPNRVQSYTEDQIEELNKCLDPVTGPLYFLSNFFYIQHPTRGKLLYDPYIFQERLVDTIHNNIFSIALCPRQVGKCLEKSINITIRNKKTG